MSRVGKKAVKLVDGVEAKISGSQVNIKGKKGSLSLILPAGIKAEVKNSEIFVEPVAGNDNPKARALWGLNRNLVNNMVTGVSEGFSITLEISGVGYRANVQGKKLNLSLGFSHPVEYLIAEGIEIKCNSPTEMVISGIDKQKVGQVAAEIRKMKKPEPYKGKGIKYSARYGKAGEVIRRKEGKKK